MKEQIDEADFEALRRAGKRYGLYINKHLNYDPTRKGGELYVSECRKRHAGKPTDEAPKGYLRYATMSEAWDFVHQFEQAFPERLNPNVRYD